MGLPVVDAVFVHLPAVHSLADDAGESPTKLAAEYGISRQSVYNYQNGSAA